MLRVLRRFVGAVVMVVSRGEGLVSPSALKLGKPDVGAAHKPLEMRRRASTACRHHCQRARSRPFLKTRASAVRVSIAVTVILGTLSLVAITSNGIAGAASNTKSTSGPANASTPKRTYGWGQAYLGNGPQSTSPVPVSIRDLTGATSVSPSDNESVALMGNGTVKTWGLNKFGQFGYRLDDSE